MAFNSDAYIADLMARGWSRTDAVNSARYEAQAQSYVDTQVASANALADKALGKEPAGTASPASPDALRPTVTIGGAPAGYQPGVTMQPSVTIGGAPAGYQSTVTPNFITGEGVPGVNGFTPSAPNYITGAGVTTTPPVVPPTVPPVSNISKDDMDAFAILERTFKDYGLEELVPAIQGYMKKNLGPNQATLLLRTEPAYVARFKGNEVRRNAGLNSLSEAEYLALEDSYSQTLRAYGVQTYLGADAKTRQKAMVDIIGNDISATEFRDRIDTVVTRVTNADKQVKETLRTFYDIKDEDLTGYFLNPKENLPKLQEKVTAAEIGAAAKSQGLTTGVTGATALAQFGITKKEAEAGYATIGEFMPTATKLGDIYKDNYTQNLAEQEVFKGTASAKRKRQQLAEQEVASFSGSSGRARTGQTSGNSGKF
jgi:hypothetical protein